MVIDIEKTIPIYRTEKINPDRLKKSVGAFVRGGSKPPPYNSFLFGILYENTSNSSTPMAFSSATEASTSAWVLKFGI